MLAPNTQVIGTNVLITWTQPYDNGDAITSYTIYIANATGSYLEQGIGSVCDGTNATIISQLSCNVSLLDL
jgi:hypothetical protein